MELYITVSFWLGVFAMIIRLILLNGNYPRIERKTLGGDLVGIVIGLCFLFWSGSILFG